MLRAVGIVVLGIFGYGALSSVRVIRAELDAAPMRSERPLVSVPVLSVDLQSYTPMLRTYGFVESTQDWSVVADSPGRIVEVSDSFNPGARLKQGDFLLRIRDADTALRLEKARIDKTRLSAQLENLERQRDVAAQISGLMKEKVDVSEQRLKRARRLHVQGTAASSNLEEVELSTLQTRITAAEQGASELSIQEQILTTRGQLETADLELNNYERMQASLTVTAPFDGAVATVVVAVGEPVQAGQVLGKLVNLEVPEVRFDMPNADLATLRQVYGKAEGVAVTVMADGSAIPVDATIDRVSVVRSETSTARTVYARINNPSLKHEAVVVGDFVTILIPLRPLASVAVIPEVAIGSSDQVLVVGEDDRIEPQAVEVLAQEGDEVAVRGLAEGARVVLEQDARLVEGMAVRPVDREAGLEGPATR